MLSISPTFKYQNYSGTVSIDNSNTYYKIEDNILYSYDGNTLVTVLYKIDGDFEMNENVETIGGYAFHHQEEMTNIKLCNNLITINDSFQYCTGLKRIEIPSSVETISSSAFYSTSNLTEIIVKKSENSIAGAPWGNDYGDKAISWKPEE